MKEMHCTKIKSEVQLTKDRLYSKEKEQSLNSGLKVRRGPTAEITNRKQEMTSAAMQKLCQGEKGRGGGRKEQSREVGAAPQLHQHYCSLSD